MGTKYKQSPVGIARHPWVNRPDVKFVTEGLFHTELVVEGEAANAYKAEIDTLVDEAFTKEVAREKEANPKFDAKKWGKYYPYDVETDPENGAPTGRIVFKFKQNAVIHLKDGGTKKIVIGIRDGKNKPITTNIFGGAEIRTLYSTRSTKLATAKQFGVRLDFAMVQLLKEAPASGGGFDEVEGAYTGGTEDTPTEPHSDY